MTSRRRFLSLVPLAGAATLARAQAPAAVDPADPNAVALGYVTDATKADKARYTKYAAGQACGNCAVFQARAGSTTGVCPVFGNRLVPVNGWCNAYVKKP